MITGLIKEMVEKECNRPQNVLDTAFFKEHILIVRDYACKLAEKLGADQEVVELSAYLHDLSVVRDYNSISNHAIISADIAELALKNELYDLDKAKMVSKAITTHVKPIQIGHGSLEEICLSNADAISQIVKPAYWMFFAFSIRKLSFQQGIEWYRQRVEDNWNNLIQPAKDLIQDEYNMIKSIF
jgi:uncharacterized protein